MIALALALLAAPINWDDTEDLISGFDTTTMQAPVAYDREEFGSAWKDVDDNGCDTRNDILADQLEDIDYRADGASSCPNATVASGTLEDPYTGETIDFNRSEDASAIQIDHIVPLSWAWANGAWDWDEETRERFANDPNNLLAVDGPANMSKSDHGPSEWMPDNSDFACEYVVRFAGIVNDYSLTIPVADQEAMTHTLNQCDENGTTVDTRTPAQANGQDGNYDDVLKIAGAVVVLIIISALKKSGHRR